MVMTTHSYNDLKQAIGMDISIAELESALFDLGMELKSHTKNSAEDGMSVDEELAVEITAERLDLISLQGLARALKSYLGLVSSAPKFTVHESDYVVKIESVVKQVRPYTRCAIVKNLKITDERLKQIIEVQEKLHDTLARGRRRGAIGIYPLEHITLPITYTADAPQNFSFVPLGETEKMNGLQILQRHETGRAYAHLLEGMKVFPYFIDAAGEILSMPPIINSESTGRITETTTDVFIECSGFEKNLLHQLLTHLTTMFADMGGKIYSMQLQYEDGTVEITPSLQPLQRTFRPYRVKEHIGLDLPNEEIKKMLYRMMYDITDSSTETWKLLIPPFRFDLWHEVDILDDVARAYGFNNLTLTIPKVATPGGVLPLSRLQEELSTVMIGLGFLETYTFSLTGKKEQLENMLLSEDKISFVSISNGNEMQQMLRISLIPQQLQSFANNRNRPLPQSIFECADVVLRDQTRDVKARNELHITALITDKVVTFTQIRQTLDALIRTRGKSIAIQPTEHPSFISGRAGVVLLDGKQIGLIGEIHPQVLDNFGLQAPVAAFELNVEHLL